MGQCRGGLIQRARLLESVVADVYGPQKLVATVICPPPSSQAAAISRARGRRPRRGIISVCGDLARGPHGQWRVLGDRLRLANGVGYALENRLAFAGTGSLLSDIHARRLAGFLDNCVRGFRPIARVNRRASLLTPGRFNQSYPEQAHLARYLGFPLVEGRDLSVMTALCPHDWRAEGSMPCGAGSTPIRWTR
jgi:uncharacterized circularly permuted ATP-grasp superfamily protein